MMNPKVSIVVPVYNCEAYLPECIASLRAQTLKEIEMIFVCDASPDNSLAILHAAQKEDARIRVIAFAENRGVSAARNAGIDAAQGEYIGFCDSDDWVEPPMYGRLYEMAKTHAADISFCRVFKDLPDRQENVPLGFDTGVRFDEAAIRNTLIPAMLARETDSDELPLSGYTPRNLFRRATMGDIRFRPDIRYAEDLLFIVQCMLHAQAAVAVDEAHYHYRFHAGSVTKRYSPHVPASHDLSNDALEALLAAYPECMRRMKIRRRKMAVTAVRNYCLPGTPHGLFARWRAAKAYMLRSDVRSWYGDVRLSGLPKSLAVKLALVKYHLALASVLLYSYVFDRV
ncbi:MAG: glycosyltransferase [Clostridia bacterium]|nr:glycosyltransferase [Clostridia bacterium]